MSPFLQDFWPLSLAGCCVRGGGLAHKCSSCNQLLALKGFAQVNAFLNTPNSDHYSRKNEFTRKRLKQSSSYFTTNFNF